jgi:hypothetical protein
MHSTASHLLHGISDGSRFNPAFFGFANFANTAAFVGSGTQSARRSTVKGRTTVP